EAWSRKSVKPLVRSIQRRYNPPVSSILTQASVVQHKLGWNENRMAVRIGWLQRETSPVPHFVLFDEDAKYVGRSKHVILALGHGPLALPPVLAEAKATPELGDQIAQAYEAKSYAC